MRMRGRERNEGMCANRGRHRSGKEKDAREGSGADTRRHHCGGGEMEGQVASWSSSTMMGAASPIHRYDREGYNSLGVTASMARTAVFPNAQSNYGFFPVERPRRAISLRF